MAGAARRIIQRLPTERITGALSQTLLGGVLLQVTLMVTGVVLARALGPDDRGHFALITLVWAVATQVGGLGIPYALSYAASRDPGSTWMAMRSTARHLTLQLLLATVAGAAVLAPLVQHRPVYVAWGAVISVAVIAPAILQQYGLNILQGLRRFTEFNALRLLPNGSFAVVASVLWLVDATNFTLFVAVWGASRAVWAPVTLRAARGRAKRAHSGDTPPPPTAHLLRYGRRAMLGASSPVETYRVDQSVVALFLSPAALGYYMVALAFTNLPRFIARSAGMVASPVTASERTHAQALQTMWRYCLIAAPMYLSAIGLLWAFVPRLTVVFFGAEFAQSASVTRLLLIATALFCARRVLADAARGAGYPGLGSVAEVVALAAALPMLTVFVPIWGLTGVGYALTISSTMALVVLVATLLLASRRGAPQGWREAGDHLPPECRRLVS